MEQAKTLQVLTPGGLVAGQFRVGEMVGAGGMGVVYRAVDIAKNEPVALKILSRGGPEHLARFEREATTLAGLRHSGIVTYLAHGLTPEDSPFLAMEWLEGEDLASRIARGPLSVDETLALALSIAEALAFAHQQGIIHRDLKPQNLFLTRDGIKILDFGLARPILQDHRLTQSGTLMGTPAYMAPEQIRSGAADARSDVFALGCVLHECLTGTPAFAGTSFEATLASVLSTEPSWLPAVHREVPDNLAAIVAQLLRKDPSERPSSGGDVLALLRALPARGEGAPRRDASVVRKLPCSAWLAWGFLADSDRWDRILGAPPSSYSIETFAGRPVSVGSADLFGLPSRWLEVGEWIEGRWGYGERRLLGGPFQTLGYRVEVRDLEDGCEVEFRAYVIATPLAPEGALELVIARFERKLRQYIDALEAFLKKISAALPVQRQGSACEAARSLLLRFGPDPLLTGKRSESFPASFEARAAGFLARVPGESSERLVQYLLQAPDEQVKRLRHEELADLFEQEPREMLRTLLRATQEGLLDLSWEASCPACRVATHDAPALASGKGSCRLCRLDFSLDLATNLEVTFRPSAGTRAVSSQAFCGSSPATRTHLVAQFILSPGERRLVEGLPQESLLLRAGQGADARPLNPPAGEAIFDGGDWRLVSGDGRGLWLENRGTERIVATVERPPQSFQEPSALLSCPEFEALLPACAPELQVGASTLVLLWLELAGLDTIFDTQSDAAALEILRSRTESVRREIDKAGGAILQESGEHLLASFGARMAARTAFRAVGEAPCEHASSLAIRGVLLEGPALVIARGGRIELFGRTIRDARRALDRGNPGLVELPS